MLWLLATQKKVKYFTQKLRVLIKQSFMLGQKPVGMVFMEHLWHQQNLMRTLKRKNQPFKLEIHLQKNYY